MKSLIIVKTAEYDQSLSGRITEAIEELGPIGIADGDRLALKINLCDARTPDTAAITHPFFLDQLLKCLREKYPRSEIYVVESDGTVAFADEFIKWFGFLPILDKWKARWFNLSKDKIINKKINGLALSEVPVPELLTHAKLINVPKLKTNMLTQITCCLKNLFGCLPVIEKGNFHPQIDKVIADVNTVYRPVLNLVDGILAMGGARGPASGVPIRTNLLIAGRDAVAIDTLVARIMGLNPGKIKHITYAQKAGIGKMEYEIKGKLEKYDFEIDKYELMQFTLGGKVQDALRKRFRKTANK